MTITGTYMLYGRVIETEVRPFILIIQMIIGMTWLVTDIKINDKSGESLEAIKISSDDNGHVFVVWDTKDEYMEINGDIYFNYSDDYGMTWQPNKIRLDTGDALQGHMIRMLLK